MPLERSVDLPVTRRPPRPWLLYAIVTTALAVTTSALAILASSARIPVDRDRGVYLPTERRLVPSVSACPKVERDDAPHDYTDPWGTTLRITCVPIRYRGQDHDWAMTRSAGADGQLYTADDTCWWASAACDKPSLIQIPNAATRRD